MDPDVNAVTSNSKANFKEAIIRLVNCLTTGAVMLKTRAIFPTKRQQEPKPQKLHFQGGHFAQLKK